MAISIQPPVPDAWEWSVEDADGNGLGFFDYEQDAFGTHDFQFGEDWNLEFGTTVDEDDTDVISVASGTVVLAGFVDGYGPNTTIVQHASPQAGVSNGSLFSLYGHMDASYVDVGDVVSQGTALGSVGGAYDSTPGNDGAVHLRFVVYETNAGLYVPPLGIDEEQFTASEGPGDSAYVDSVVFDAFGNVVSFVMFLGGDDHVRFFDTFEYANESADAVRHYDYDDDDRFVVGDSAIMDSHDIFGLDGDDVIHGSKAGDVISGGEGDDTLFGRAGSDSIYGDAGADILGGLAGVADHLVGGTGQDTILSRGQGDILVGGTYALINEKGGLYTSGLDLTDGDGDSDTFVFAGSSAGDAYIHDFETGLDVIDLSLFDVGFGDLEIEGVVGAPGDALVVIGRLNIHLGGVSPDQIVAEDFIF